MRVSRRTLLGHAEFLRSGGLEHHKRAHIPIVGPLLSGLLGNGKGPTGSAPAPQLPAPSSVPTPPSDLPSQGDTGSFGGSSGGSAGGNDGGSAGGNAGGSAGGSVAGSAGGSVAGSAGGNAGVSAGGNAGGSAGGNSGGNSGGVNSGSPTDNTSPQQPPGSPNSGNGGGNLSAPSSATPSDIGAGGTTSALPPGVQPSDISTDSPNALAVSSVSGGFAGAQPTAFRSGAHGGLTPTGINPDGSPAYPSDPANPPKPGHQHLSKGAIAGIIIAILFLIGINAMTIVICCRCRNRARRGAKTERRLQWWASRPVSHPGDRRKSPEDRLKTKTMRSSFGTNVDFSQAAYVESYSDLTPSSPQMAEVRGDTIPSLPHDWSSPPIYRDGSRSSYVPIPSKRGSDQSSVDAFMGACQFSSPEILPFPDFGTSSPANTTPQKSATVRFVDQDKSHTHQTAPYISSSSMTPVLSDRISLSTISEESFLGDLDNGHAQLTTSYISSIPSSLITPVVSDRFSLSTISEESDPNSAPSIGH